MDDDFSDWDWVGVSFFLLIALPFVWMGFGIVFLFKLPKAAIPLFGYIWHKVSDGERK